jgi:hypothetical protein
VIHIVILNERIKQNSSCLLAEVKSGGANVGLLFAGSLHDARSVYLFKNGHPEIMGVSSLSMNAMTSI